MSVLIFFSIALPQIPTMKTNFHIIEKNTLRRNLCAFMVFKEAVSKPLKFEGLLQESFEPFVIL